ncbi:hypothetical protein CEUSTIGMA_g5015.t1 [Chlamydomonas eustigma]|uniref:Uncharacterized protein n=1 Tax=Chlamydomonas eustigma TaxID=1157962 RepID=A0A250X3D6_9CHLO|nr:hypothetical protein CEUSTIGMA_g5015.t1 [Chlamydomonas eustigma]|eukprot:GAX77571.1 hypothetical protein CEUSTIGMA_g5015.t1 [Chlamydomonas eustigma]
MFLTTRHEAAVNPHLQAVEEVVAESGRNAPCKPTSTPPAFKRVHPEHPLPHGAIEHPLLTSGGGSSVKMTARTDTCISLGAADLSNYEKLLQGLQRKLAAARYEVDDLQQVIQTMREHHSIQCRGYEAKLREMEMKARSETMLGAVQTELEVTSLRATEAESKVEKLERQFNDEQEARRRAEEKVVTLTVQCDDDKLAASLAHSAIAELQKEVHALKQQAAVLKTDKEHAEARRRQELDANSKLQDDIASLSRQVVAHQEGSSSAQKALAQLQHELHREAQQVQTERELRAGLEAELRAARDTEMAFQRARAQRLSHAIAGAAGDIGRLLQELHAQAMELTLSPNLDAPAMSRIPVVPVTSWAPTQDAGQQPQHVDKCLNHEGQELHHNNQQYLPDYDIAQQAHFSHSISAHASRPQSISKQAAQRLLHFETQADDSDFPIHPFVPPLIAPEVPDSAGLGSMPVASMEGAVHGHSAPSLSLWNGAVGCGAAASGLPVPAPALGEVGELDEKVDMNVEAGVHDSEVEDEHQDLHVEAGEHDGKVPDQQEDMNMEAGEHDGKVPDQQEDMNMEAGEDDGKVPDQQEDMNMEANGSTHSDPFVEGEVHVRGQEKGTAEEVEMCDAVRVEESLIVEHLGGTESLHMLDCAHGGQPPLELPHYTNGSILQHPSEGVVVGFTATAYFTDLIPPHQPSGVSEKSLAVEMLGEEEMNSSGIASEQVPHAGTASLQRVPLTEVQNQTISVRDNGKCGSQLLELHGGVTSRP